MEEQADVIVAGGGPVGLGLAIELGQRGIRTLVIERYPAPQPVPKGQNLTQRTMEHFHFWGAEKALRQARTIPNSMGIGGITAYRTLFSGFHYDWLQRALVRPFYYTENERLPQYATEEVLRARVAALDTVTMLTSWSVIAATEDQDGVGVTAQERSTGTEQRFRAAYLAGCDGSRSLVRSAAGITETREDHDRLMVLLVFRSIQLNHMLDQFPGKMYFNVLHPELAGYWKFFGRVDLDATFFFHAPVPQSARNGDFDFAAYVREAVGAPVDLDISYTGFWDLRFALADRYRAGRIFVAGDAAHSHPPYGGYGINTGFEDARNLGWKLAAALQGWGGERLLDSYSDERRAVFESTMRDFIARSIEVDREFLARHDRDRDPAGFDAAWAGRATAAQAEVGSFEPNYRGSSVIWGKSGASSGALGTHDYIAEAGRHLAPLELGSGLNAYDCLGQGFTLFASTDPGDFAAAAETLHVPLQIVRDSNHRYGASLILVRPDQFVAWTGDTAVNAESILRKAAGFDEVEG